MVKSERDRIKKLKREGYFICTKCGLISKDPDLFIKGKNLCRQTDLLLSNCRHKWNEIVGSLGKTSQVSAGKILKHAEKKIALGEDRDNIVLYLIVLTKGVLSWKQACWIYMYCMTNTKFGLSLMTPERWRELQVFYRETVDRPYKSRKKRSGKRCLVKQYVFFPECERVNRIRKGKRGLRILDPGP